MYIRYQVKLDIVVKYDPNTIRVWSKKSGQLRLALAKTKTRNPLVSNVVLRSKPLPFHISFLSEKVTFMENGSLSHTNRKAASLFLIFHLNNPLTGGPARDILKDPFKDLLIASLPSSIL